MLAITGRDLAADFRGTYASKAEAYRLLAKSGGFEALATKALGPEIPPAIAQVGDVGLVEVGSNRSFVIRDGADWIGAGLPGVGAVDSATITKAWRCC